jgi:hypothetical protein
MEPSQHTPDRTGIVVLDKVFTDSVPEIIRMSVCFHEKTAPVLEYTGFDQDNLGDVETLKNEWHGLLFQ